FSLSFRRLAQSDAPDGQPEDVLGHHFSFSGVSGGGSGSADGDVTERATRADLDGVLTRLRRAGGLRLAVGVPEVGLEGEPGGDALTDTHLDLAVAGLCADGPSRDLSEKDVAVAGLGGDRLPGTVDGDPSTGGAHLEAATDLADPGFASGAPDRRGAIDGPDPHRPRPGADLGLPRHPIDGDVPSAGAQLHGTGSTEADLSCTGPDVTVTQKPGGAER